jgi:hypothetical protein
MVKRLCVEGRVVPRAFRVCAQGAVLCQLFALSVSIIAQFVLFWLAELRPRRKTVQIIALQQETAHYNRAEGKHAGRPQPRAGLICNVDRFFQYDCSLHEERQIWNDDDIVAW